nr:MAG TPA: hypothetical protein [Caudoviricetes sp.]DAO47093.1 MAG TPA: hypothetical protein [Caudoviricetes sp.]
MTLQVVRSGIEESERFFSNRSCAINVLYLPRKLIAATSLDLPFR